jgi:sugar lactone lactonase YvrE
VTFDNAGNLLTLDLDAGIVYSIDLAGQKRVVADLPDFIAGYAGPAFDPVSGNIFVSRYLNQSGDEILRIAPNGSVSVFASGIPVPLSMTTDAAGNLYVTSYACPASVYKVTPNGAVSVFATGLCRADGPEFDQAGNLYVSDRSTNRIMRVPPAGGVATQFATGFDIPTDVVFDQQGNMLVANSNNGTIDLVDSQGVRRGFGIGFTNPVALAFDHDGKLFIADLGAGQIYKATPKPQSVPTIPGYTVTPFASVPHARGVAFDTTGNLLTLDPDAGIVYSIDPAGQKRVVADLPNFIAGYIGPAFDEVSGNIFVSNYLKGSGNEVLRIAPNGSVSVFASGIPAPQGITTNPSGNLYVGSYTCPGSVYNATPDGAVSVFATGLCRPDGPEFDAVGNLYIADRGTNRIMRVPPTGGVATQFATGLDIPTGIVFDQQGNLLVANSNNGTIALVDSQGVSRPFGIGFTNPVELAFDRAGKLFIADLGAGQIYKATPIDPIPPVADHLTINGGALATTSADVRLDVSAADADHSQVGLSMSFSNDGATWSDWQPYVPATPWQLSGGDGLKTVYGRFKSSAGGISAIVSDTITLDTSVQTEYGVTINNGALYTNKVAVRLKISARPRTAEIQVSNDGGFEGAAWEPYATYKNWQLTRYRHTEITLLVFVRFRNVDGNVTAASDSIILDINPPDGHAQAVDTDEAPRLVLTASDDVSGVGLMRVSAQPDFADTSWEAFAASRSWDFESNPIAYVQFRDNAGNVSPTYEASLTRTRTVFVPLVLR